MKLAEALIEKKDLAGRLSTLQTRYTEAALIEEGATPDETAADLLVLLTAAFSRWEELTVAINVSNNKIQVADTGLTMMQCLAHRDSLKSQISHFNIITDSLRQRNSSRNRYITDNGPKMVIAEGVDVKSFIKLVDNLHKELRVLDTQIQAANWANELTT